MQFIENMNRIDKKYLYETIMLNVAQIVKNALIEETLTQEEKMKAWHDGTRNQNVGALSAEKLKQNYQICIDAGYDKEASILRDEAKKRHIKLDNDLNEGIHPTHDIPALNINWDAITRMHHWWDGITYDNPKKYKANDLKAYDIIYDMIVWRIEKTMHLKNVEKVTIIFKDEKEWQLCIDRNTAYGSYTYTMYAHGNSAPWRIPYSSMLINMKRSIKQRLEEKTFYIYYIKKYNEYVLRETPEFNGETGILLN